MPAYVLVEYASKVVFLFLLGSVIGSFLNVLICRLPEREGFWAGLRSIYTPLSRCPSCLTPIRPRDNIPFLGWIMLRGRCRTCRRRISIRYPLIELLTAVLFVATHVCEVPPSSFLVGDAGSLFHVAGPQGVPGSPWFNPAILPTWRLGLHLVLISALIAATFIDFDHQIIPDTVTVPALCVALVAHTAIGRLYIIPVWFQDPQHQLLYGSLLFDPRGEASIWKNIWLQLITPGVPQWLTQHPHWHGLLVSLAGLLVGGGVVWAVRIVGHLTLRREAMGFGDVMLMAMVGSFLGWQAALVVFFIAPAFALVSVLFSMVISRSREIPYGPYLSLATVALLLGWKVIWPPWERGIFALGPLLPVAGLAMLVTLAGLLKATRMVMTRLGFVDDDRWVLVWRPADQLTYQAGERIDLDRWGWQTKRWPGDATGKGLSHTESWRSSGPNNNGWSQRWQFRP